LPVHVAPEARFELGLDLLAPRKVSAASVPRLLLALATGRGRPRDAINGHDLDRIEIRCDSPQPLQVDGEDLGDVDAAIFEAEREAVIVLV
jgi:diacylglycerol kinase family enzyme